MFMVSLLSLKYSSEKPHMKTQIKKQIKMGNPLPQN